MNKDVKERLINLYKNNKAELYEYKINDKTFNEIAESNNIDVDELVTSYFENGDILLAQLEVSQKKMLGKEMVNTLTMNGTISPDDVYDYISKAASTVLNFKYNKAMLLRSIIRCDDEEYIALSPMDIAMLIINIESKDKDIYSEDDKHLLNEIFKLSEKNPIIIGEDAKQILQFIESKRLLTKDNSDLYNRFIIASNSEKQLDYLLYEDKKELMNNSLDSIDNENKYINEEYNYRKEYEENSKTKKKSL